MKTMVSAEVFETGSRRREKTVRGSLQRKVVVRRAGMDGLLNLNLVAWGLKEQQTLGSIECWRVARRKLALVSNISIDPRYFLVLRFPGKDKWA